MQIGMEKQDIFLKRTIQENLDELVHDFPGKIVFSTSFGLEDQVITHFLYGTGINVFTLDTGRLFPETYSTWSATIERYGIYIETYYPDAEKLQEFVSVEGPNAFYASVENRKKCCGIRKVEPLQRALQSAAVWITGIRAAQSSERMNTPILEWDDQNEVLKYHPLLHWDDKKLKDFIRENNIPYNILHDRGFVSIGCAPCTRAIKPGENFRAGRWWWEDDTKKECGLHLHQG
ncbi:MAG: phosphoadenylyl-sulfate reductase [Chitinophagaceae bacterium]